MKAKKLASIVMVIAIAMNLCACNTTAYDNAIALYMKEDYSAAAAAFKALGNYKDSKEYMALANDKLLMAEVSGKWLSAPVDFSEAFFKEMGADVAYLDDSAYSYNISAVVTLELNKSGEIKGYVDEKNNQALMTSCKHILVDSILNAYEEELINIAKETNTSVADLLKYENVSSVEELLELYSGMDIDQYAADLLHDAFADFYKSSEFTGTYKFENGKMVFTFDDDDNSDLGDYNSTTQTIIISTSRMLEGEYSTYVFNRA